MLTSNLSTTFSDHLSANNVLDLFNKTATFAANELYEVRGNCLLSCIQAFLNRVLFTYTYPYNYTDAKYPVELTALRCIQDWADTKNGTVQHWKFVPISNQEEISDATVLRIDLNQCKYLATKMSTKTPLEEISYPDFTELCCAVAKLAGYGDIDVDCISRREEEDTLTLCIVLLPLPSGALEAELDYDSMYTATC
jgi:hypothetical protein